jgi:exodeoxyribonuclease V alpha subunit
MTSDPNCSRLDYAFSRFFGQRCLLEGENQVAFESLLLKLSNRLSSGHSCISINTHEQALLQGSGLASVNGELPLVLERDRLYTRRYWHYENRLAAQLSNLCDKRYEFQQLEHALDRYFVVLIDETDWQREAARAALTQAFSIITGGPGTGKTTTVVKILALLQELSSSSLHIALAAPTGKAAMRLQESIGSSKRALPCGEKIKQLIPEQVSTLHQLLGAQPPTPYFRHCAAQPLVYDLVVIDEASMVDLALMSKLVDALKPGSRLLLLGDKDQLASVEAGAVLADLTNALPKHTQTLQKAHRFRGEIKVLAEAVNRQQADRAWQLLKNDQSEVGLVYEKLADYVVSRYQNYWNALSHGADFMEIFAVFNQFRVLCSNRTGGQSVVGINLQVERWLHQQGSVSTGMQWYAGRPVMITQNDSGLKLFNGDIGLCLPDPARNGRLLVHFLRPDGSVKTVLPARLPTCETVYAMTIHKSQGSEFDHVMLVLAEQVNPVLSKELLYTGITRARKSVKVVASEDVFMATLMQRVQRDSGLSEKLLAMGAE